MSVSIDWESLRQKLEPYKQTHLMKWIEELSQKEQEQLYKELTEINFEKLERYYKRAKHTLDELKKKKDDRLKPLDSSICGSTTNNDAAVRQWRQRGLEMISRGEVGVLLMAGGQGTRLGTAKPKGMYNVGLPSKKTLYQLQAERILRLQQIATETFGTTCTIPWYIMTSEYTRDTTVDFFKEHKYFGLSPDNVIVFEQETLPCLTYDGKVILDQKYRVARAPNGNGGLYSSLIQTNNNILNKMKSRGVKYIHVYGVDNILVKMADPVFIGFCNEKDAECGAKVVIKDAPSEKVGVVCILDDKYQVVEYSEISSETAELRNPDGSLTFSAGNICNHYFTVDFLEQICCKYEEQLVHHVAEKKIPYINEEGQRIEPTKPNGMKLEKFVFDVFQFSKKFAVLDVQRDDEFSPLKNAPGAERDCPSTCRDSLMNLHRRQITAAGGVVTGYENGTVTSEGSSVLVCEISPLLSYFGEGLEAICKGKSFRQPILLDVNKSSSPES